MPRSPAVQATAQVFADIARAMHLVAPVIRQACIAMAVGSNITWKDLYTSILLGGIYLPDPPVDEL